MKAIENIAVLMVENDRCKEEDKDIIIYGLTMALEISAMIITIILLGLTFGFLVEGLLFFISFSAIRTFAGGYHCNSGKVCYFASSFIVVLFYVLLRFVDTEYMLLISIIFLIISIPVILTLAPISTKNNPLDNKARIHFRKKVISNLLIECVVILILLSIGFNKYAFVMSIGIFISGILVAIQRIISLSGKK